METKEKQVAVAIFVVIFLLLGAVLIFPQNNTTYNKNPPKPLDRTIEFPRDEGKHNEPEEVWAILMNISTENGDFFVWVSWSTSYFDPINSTVIVSVIDSSNYTGKGFNSVSYKGSHFKYSENWSQLEFSYNGNSLNFMSEDNETSNYTLSAISDIGNESYGMDIHFVSIKKPVLFTQNTGDSLRYGSLYFENGTIFGYIQPRFSISGSLVIGEKEWNIWGKAALLHYWGGSSVEIFEFLYAESEEKDILSLTYYAPGGERVVLEQLYVIYKGAYTLYSTVRGDTIGAYIENDTYRDLKGETYSLYPTSYLLDPTDPYHSRAYARNWTISSSYDRLKIEIYPMIKNQFVQGTSWAGATYAEENGHRTGWGFSVLNKRYVSSPYILHIESGKKNIDGKWYFNINASVSDSIPIKKVIVYYNSSEGDFFAPLEWNENAGVWTVTVGAFNSGDKITYRLVVIDSAGSKVSSGEFNETFL